MSYYYLYWPKVYRPMFWRQSSVATEDVESEPSVKRAGVGGRCAACWSSTCCCIFAILVAMLVVSLLVGLVILPAFGKCFVVTLRSLSVALTTVASSLLSFLLLCVMVVVVVIVVVVVAIVVVVVVVVVITLLSLPSSPSSSPSLTLSLSLLSVLLLSSPSWTSSSSS